MSKEIFTKKNKIKVTEKVESKEKNDKNILNNYLKKKNIKIDILNKKDLLKMRKANTPDINKKLLNLKVTQLKKQPPLLTDKLKIFETISAPKRNQRNNSLKSIYHQKYHKVRT